MLRGGIGFQLLQAVTAVTQWQQHHYGGTRMKCHLNCIGSVAGYVGIITCAAGVFGRFHGDYHFIGFQAADVFLMGVALMTLGCWAKLEAASCCRKSADTTGACGQPAEHQPTK